MKRTKISNSAWVADLQRVRRRRYLLQVIRVWGGVIHPQSRARIHKGMQGEGCPGLGHRLGPVEAP